MQTRRPLTPIERMMDRAMGHEGDGTAPVYVTLRCPQCKKSQQAKAEEIDPDGTTLIECHCPECHDGVSESEVFYYDKNGKQIVNA